MSEPSAIEAGQRVGRRPRRDRAKAARVVDYRHLRNTFRPQAIFSEDQIASIHFTATRVLEELGLRVLLPEARRIYRRLGCIVDEETMMVRIGRELVASALASAPRSIVMKGGAPERDIVLEHGALAFVAGSGCPNVTDRDRGRRPGRLIDFEESVKLVQAFDILHMMGPHLEPQDVDLRFRHYATMRAQLTLSDKVPFVFARGTRQVEESFVMLKLARGVSDDGFLRTPHCYTIINTNSPRQLDIPMGQGIIDFARAGQVSVITPFCLAGAMAPITVAGALTLQHAEALAGIVLAQAVRPGSPVVYGSFSSNVDMKSGSPAFGTPEHAKATLAAGQLARYINLPWRGGGGSAANVSDAQAANETQFALWGASLAGVTMFVHAAGWLEGGLSFSYEKLITDIEVLQMLAEMFVSTPADEDAIAFDAIAEVQPGGHFFSAEHTMSRYRDAFYEPFVADWSNFGNWTVAGAQDATQRATGIWTNTLKDFTPPASVAGADDLLVPFIEAGTAAGGATPVS